MGLPDDGYGLSKKRFRLGLNSKRKGNLKEPCVDQSDPLIINSSDIMTATTNPEKGKKPVYDNINSPQQKEPLVAPVTSLYNIGNTCYLNCILQTLRFTPGFIKHLSELKDSIRVEESRSKGKISERTATVWKLVESLDELFCHMRGKESDYKDLCPTDSVTMSIRPDTLLDQIRKFNPLFEENYQHDAQELLRSLLGCLDDAETELEKVEAERRFKDVDENRDNMDSDHKKEIKKERSDNSSDNGVAHAPETSKHLRKKRKLDKKEQESDNQLHNWLTKKCLNKKRLVAVQQEKKDGVCNDIDNRNEVINNCCVEDSEFASKECQPDVCKGPGVNVNSSGDAHHCINSLDAPKKGHTLHMRRSKSSKSRKKSSDGGDKSEMIIISSDDENGDMSYDNENIAKSFVDSPRKRKSSEGVDEITEDPLLDSPAQKTSPKSRKNNGERCMSDSEDYLMSIEQNENQHMISPGKHLTIHSPFSKGKHTSSSSFQSIRFSSGIQGSLSNMTNVSFNGPITTQQTDIPATTSISLSQGPQIISPSSPMSKGDSTEKSSSRLYEAKLTLKRCDWLGVSPVRSISANLVMERIKHELDVPHDSPSKRKLNFESHEAVDLKRRAVEIDCVTNPGNEKLKCDSSNYKIRERESNFVSNHKYVGNIASYDKKCDIQVANSECLSEYRGCKIKPLSVRLKKLHWLGIGSQEQSFNLQEIFKKNDIETRSPGSSNDDDFCKEPVKDEECGKQGPGCQHFEGKPKPEEVRQKLVQGLFGGVMGHRTRCCECEKNSNRSETFLDVSIPVRILSSNNNSKSSDEDDDAEEDTKSCVYKLLKSLSIRERLCDDNKYFCNQCYSLVEAEHFCFFQDLPKVLAIHLKRFDAGLGSLAGYVSKISDHVSVPEHLPCLIPTCNDSRCGHRYSLYAVVTHSGSSILHGHYRSYVKVTSSFNSQLNGYMNENELMNYQGNSSPTPHAFSQSMISTENDGPVIDTNASTTSLVGNTVEDIRNDSFMFSTRLQNIDKRCDIGDGLASMSSKCGQETNGMGEMTGDKKSWWLECDDESIRVFEEEDFLDRISGNSMCALLGTPYILFYHQNYATL